MGRIGGEVIRDLLRSPLAAVQRFAGELLLGHQELAQQPPTDILHTLLNSLHAPVRQLGVRIIGQLPDPVLKQSFDLMFALSRSEHVEVRETIRPVLRRLAAADQAWGRRLAAAWAEALLIPGARRACPVIPRSRCGRSSATAWTRSARGRSGSCCSPRSRPANEIGALLLESNVRPEELSVAEIIQLANHELLAVRQASWAMCRRATGAGAGGPGRRGANPGCQMGGLAAIWNAAVPRQLPQTRCRGNPRAPFPTACGRTFQRFGDRSSGRFQEESGADYLLKRANAVGVDAKVHDAAVGTLRERARRTVAVPASPTFSVLSRVNQAAWPGSRPGFPGSRGGVNRRSGADRRRDPGSAIGHGARSTSGHDESDAPDPRGTPNIPLPLTVQPRGGDAVEFAYMADRRSSATPLARGYFGPQHAASRHSLPVNCGRSTLREAINALRNIVVRCSWHPRTTRPIGPGSPGKRKSIGLWSQPSVGKSLTRSRRCSRELNELRCRSQERQQPLNAARRRYFDYLYQCDRDAWFVLDPVITVHPDEVFFECFSQDESSYGRLTARL